MTCMNGQNGDGLRRSVIGFRYDKSSGGTIELRLVPGNIRNEGVGGGRPAVKRDAMWTSDTGWLDWNF